MKKDRFITGLIAGLIWPIVVYGLLLALLDLLDAMNIVARDAYASDFDTRTLSLVAVGCNIFLMQYFNKKRWHNAMRGLMLPTMAMCIIWLITYYDVLF